VLPGRAIEGSPCPSAEIKLWSVDHAVQPTSDNGHRRDRIDEFGSVHFPATACVVTSLIYRYDCIRTFHHRSACVPTSLYGGLHCRRCMILLDSLVLQVCATTHGRTEHSAAYFAAFAHRLCTFPKYAEAIRQIFFRYHRFALATVRLYRHNALRRQELGIPFQHKSFRELTPITNKIGLRRL
jgi:hypothetical protein